MRFDKAKYGDDLSSVVLRMLNEQKSEWPVVGKRFEALRHILVRKLALNEHCHVLVQCNPDRIRSSAADLSQEVLKKRPCFLCPQGRDFLQRSVPVGEYSIQVNPFPIFPAHFTITYNRHVPQSIIGRFGDFLAMMRKLDKLTVFYNGPHCGASAPDHCHFQACSRHVMPLEKEWIFCKQVIMEKTNFVVLSLLQGYCRTVFLLRGTSVDDLRLLFDKWMQQLPVEKGEYEPRMNLIGFYEDGEYIVFLLPRNASRPRCFYAQDGSQRTISPASVEMGGLFITPVLKDYQSLTATEVIEILDECTLKI